MRDITAKTAFFQALRRGVNGATSSPGSDRTFTAVGAGFQASDVGKFLIVEDDDTPEDNGVYPIDSFVSVDSVGVSKGFPEGGLSNLSFVVPRRLLDGVDPAHEYLIRQLVKYTPKNTLYDTFGNIEKELQPGAPVPGGKYYLLSQYDSDTSMYVQFDKSSGLPEDVVTDTEALSTTEGLWINNSGYRGFDLSGNFVDNINFGNSSGFFTGITDVYSVDIIVDIPYPESKGTLVRKSGTDDLSSDNDTFRLFIHEDGTIRLGVRLVGTNTTLVGSPILYNKATHYRFVVDQTGSTGDRQRLYENDMSNPVVTTDVVGTIPITGTVPLDFGLSVASESPAFQVLEFMISSVARSNQVL